MSRLSDLQGYTPTIYDDVTEIQELLNTEAIEYEELDCNIDDVKSDIFIDTALDSGLKRYEKIFNISVPLGSTLDQRRSVVKSVLRGIDKLSATVIKNISLAYDNGEVEVSFVPSNIIVRFMSIIGLPSNIEELKKYLNERKPAHIGIIYVIRYLTVNEVQNKKIAQLQGIELNKFLHFE